MLSPFRMVCRDFILPEPASYVFFYAIFNLRNLLYIIESDFMGLKIPLPSPQKQQEIVDYISEVRRKIATLQLQIPLHSQRAKKEFEEAVFGEAQKRIY